MPKTPTPAAATLPMADAEKNRLNPIPSTMATVPGYPSKLTLYKTAASRYYWVRLYYHGKYKVKTTRTESLKDAKIFAVKFYEDILINANQTQTSNKDKSFTSIGHAPVSYTHLTLPTIYSV